METHHGHVAASFSKRRRKDAQILHPEVVRRLKNWLAKKADLGPDILLFPVPGQKTHKMTKGDLAEKAKEARQKSDF